MLRPLAVLALLPACTTLSGEDALQQAYDQGRADERAALQAELDELTSRLEAVEAQTVPDTAALEARVAAVEGDVSTLQADVDDNTSAIDAHTTDLATKADAADLVLLEDAVNGTGGLAERVTANEDALSDLPAGVPDLAARLDALDGGNASGVSVLDLDARVGTVEAVIGDPYGPGLLADLGTLGIIVSDHDARLIALDGGLESQVSIADLETSAGEANTLLQDQVLPRLSALDGGSASLVSVGQLDTRPRRWTGGWVRSRETWRLSRL